MVNVQPEQWFLFDIPPPGFDPETASGQELEKYGIIPRPPDSSDLFDNWRRLFKAPVTFVDPRPEPLVPPPQSPNAVAPPARPANKVRALSEPGPGPDVSPALPAGAGSRLSHSSNWSGGYIVPTNNTMVVQVAAAWRLPTLSEPSDESNPPIGSLYCCSTWVGLDGQRLYLNSSLPQVGVMQWLQPSLSPPELAPTAFCQWWYRQGNGLPLSLPGLPVAAGDFVIASVWAKTAKTAICYLRNVTTSRIAVVGMKAPWLTPQDELSISGATAEWILERPTIPGETGLYPFPDYHMTEFAAWAAVARDAGPPQAPLDLRTARGIAMYDTQDNPARTAFISMPYRKGSAAIKLEYGGFEPK
nr:G1 family glutamic endopeptidase [uncultured Rhodopila sp.]